MVFQRHWLSSIFQNWENIDHFCQILGKRREGEVWAGDWRGQMLTGSPWLHPRTRCHQSTSSRLFEQITTNYSHGKAFSTNSVEPSLEAGGEVGRQPLSLLSLRCFLQTSTYDFARQKKGEDFTVLTLFESKF